MAHPRTQAERRNTRRQFIQKRIKNGGSWTSCFCGDGYWWWQIDKPLPTWRHSGTYKEWYQSRLCWNCFDHIGNPAWIGRLDKWHLNPKPNRERDWDYNGVIRRDYRAGGGQRGNEWGIKRPRSGGPFSLIEFLQEWDSITAYTVPVWYDNDPGHFFEWDTDDNMC